jgi:hypothetical protein
MFQSAWVSVSIMFNHHATSSRNMEGLQCSPRTRMVAIECDSLRSLPAHRYKCLQRLEHCSIQGLPSKLAAMVSWNTGTFESSRATRGHKGRWFNWTCGVQEQLLAVCSRLLQETFPGTDDRWVRGGRKPESMYIANAAFCFYTISSPDCESTF